MSEYCVRIESWSYRISDTWQWSPVLLSLSRLNCRLVEYFTDFKDVYCFIFNLHIDDCGIIVSATCSNSKIFNKENKNWEEVRVDLPVDLM